MNIYLIALLGSVSYAIATKLALTTTKPTSSLTILVSPAVSFGLLSHIFTLFYLRQDIEQCGIMAMMSLLSAIIIALSLISFSINHYRLPIAIVAGFAALALWLPLCVSFTPTQIADGNTRLHIVLAMTAYVFSFFAGLYALLTLIQSHRLKRHVAFSQPETPLAVLEKLMIRSTLYALLFFGLALSVSAWLLMPKLTTRHQYKLVFAALSWLPLAWVLLRHVFQGFRGQKAATWILVGTLIAFLGYFVTGFMR